jgi:hypothetical protein
MRKQILASFLLNCKKHEEINYLVDDIKIKVILKFFSLLMSVHSLLKRILSKPTYRSSITELSSKCKKKNPLSLRSSWSWVCDGDFPNSDTNF